MQTYRVETTISDDGRLTLKKVPFQAGEKVEVIVRSHTRGQDHHERYPLRGKPVHYIDPFASVAKDDWEVLK